MATTVVWVAGAIEQLVDAGRDVDGARIYHLAHELAKTWHAGDGDPVAQIIAKYTHA